MSNELSDRIFKFVIENINFIKGLEDTVEMRIIKQQLIKSVTSTGANYEEAQGAGSMADFNNKVRISLKEIRETNYWLRLLKEICANQNKDFEKIVNESDELMRILGTIASKTYKLRK